MSALWFLFCSTLVPWVYISLQNKPHRTLTVSGTNNENKRDLCNLSCEHSWQIYVDFPETFSISIARLESSLKGCSYGVLIGTDIITVLVRLCVSELGITNCLIPWPLHSKVSFIYLTLTQLSVISLTTPPIKSVMYSLVFVSACVWILIQDDKWTNLACMNRTEDWLCAQWGMCKPQHLQMSSLDPSEFCWGPWSFKM